MSMWCVYIYIEVFIMCSNSQKKVTKLTSPRIQNGSIILSYCEFRFPKVNNAYPCNIYTYIYIYAYHYLVLHLGD